MSVHLPHHFKGTHMSRFLEVLSEHEGEVTMRTLPDILHDLKLRLDAESAHKGLRFYPRIDARLHQNISNILGARLRESHQRLMDSVRMNFD